MPHPVPIDERERWREEQDRWRLQQQPTPVPPFLFGLKLRFPDPRDWDMRRDPDIAHFLNVGFPDSADLLRHWKGPVLNQGAVPSCVSHALSHMQAIHQSIEEGGIARVFDAPRLHRETGPENQGRWPDDVLRVCQSTGVPLTSSDARYKLTSYAAAPKGNEWTPTIKAAIAAEKPCPICYLIPSNYGWESSGAITQGYHETLIVGYRADAFLMLNSWSAQWGKNGLGWVPIAFLEQQNYQSGYVWAHTVVDERANPNPQPQPEPQPQPQPQPEPQPQPSSVKIYAVAAGGGLEMLQQGQTLSASGGGFQGTLTIERVDRDTQPQPDPQPQPEPQPQPTPGDLEVLPQIFRARGGYNLFVYVKGPGEGAARVIFESAAQVFIVRSQASFDGRMPATAAVRGASAGMTIRCIAEAGSLGGEATVSVPGTIQHPVAQDGLPALVDEV